MCGQKIEATLKLAARERGVEGTVVVMEKYCSEHGLFRDILSTDPEIFYKRQKWHYDYGERPENIQIPNATSCPEDCGLCSMHHSVTCQGNIDLTTRCNLHCPWCFANAETSGIIWEPTLDQVKQMLDALYGVWPSGMNGLQFAGGEPTIAPTFLAACQYAKSLFKVVQVATNGIKFTDLEFCQQAKAAGLDGLYLQFDGTTDEIYQQTRGVALFEKKMQVLENCRKVGLWVVFVPTLIRGVNDQEIGKLFALAVKNADIMQGIAFQPIAFTGRFGAEHQIPEEERLAKRFTLDDLAWSLQKQTGGIFKAREDFYPLSVLNPVSMLLSLLWPKEGKKYLQVQNHPYCGMGTYVLVDRETGRALPVTQLFEFESLIASVHNLNVDLIEGNRNRLYGVVQALKMLQRFYKKDNPLRISFWSFLRAFSGVMGRGREGYYTSRWRMLLIGGMHFQDNWNYDIPNRLMHCDIHYAAPDPRYPDEFRVILVPFCAYNSGPCYRQEILAKFGRPYKR